MIDRSQLVGGLKSVEPTRPTLRERKVERMQVCEKECVSDIRETSVSGGPDDAALSGQGATGLRGADLGCTRETARTVGI
jgi:hypothetical protein